MAKKWSEQSRIGVYLGHSPHHAISVAWVLNITTGHVSPQFHVMFDDHFDTALHTNKQTIPSLWEEFAKQHEEPDPDDPNGEYIGTDPHTIPKGFRAPWYQMQWSARQAAASHTDKASPPAMTAPPTNPIPPHASTPYHGMGNAANDSARHPDPGGTTSLQTRPGKC